MANWQKLASTSDVQEGAPVPVDIDGTQIGLFRIQDEIFALHNICPHQYAFLTDGYQERDTIECPLHQALFDIRTGKHLTPPAQCGVRSFPVCIENEAVLVDLTEKDSPLYPTSDAMNPGT
jgi:apoptosis-inducing factor 3